MSKLPDELSSHDETTSPFPRILDSLSHAADILSVFINVNNLDMHGLKVRWNRDFGFNQMCSFGCFCAFAPRQLSHCCSIFIDAHQNHEGNLSLYVEKVGRAIAGGLQTLTSSHSASSVTDPSAALTLSPTYGA